LNIRGKRGKTNVHGTPHREEQKPTGLMIQSPRRSQLLKNVVFDEDAQWDWSSSEEEDVTWHDQGTDIFTVQYREVQAEAVEEGGGSGPNLDIPATPDASQFGLGSPYEIVHDNPIFEAEEMDNLDDSYNNEPLWFRSMSELIGPAVPPGQVQRELSTNESDRLFAVSAEEPTPVREATQEAVWRRAMVDELQSIEENKTWSLIELPTGRRAIRLKWVFKVKKNQLGDVVIHKA
jgi:hypothetical protein